MATPRKTASAAEPVEAVEPRPDFEVVGDVLVCHDMDDLRLSLVVPMAKVERWMEINAEAKSWQEQLAGWQTEIMPADVLAAIRSAAKGDGILEIKLSRQWSDGLDVRLGKALY